MSSLRRFSEPYPPTGGMASEGVRNLLGRPKLELLELLVREAVQNSWDAKLPNRDAIRVEIALRTLDREERDRLISDVVPDPPPKLPLADQLQRGELRLLTFADRGTLGLEGDIRSNTTQEGEPSDFVDFVRNIGQPPDRRLGAGSFGYGKGAFYLLSRASTILVHTQCRHGSGIEARLIVCALGNHYNDPGGGVRRTGRHWWGEMVDDVVDPLVGPEADALARSLGLPAFAEGETGTTIGIVAPRLELAGVEREERSSEDDAEDPRVALEFIGDALAWNFWPKMIGLRGRQPSMRFALSLDGEDVDIPNPDTDPRLTLFASAMRALVGDESPDAGLGGRVVEAWCKRPPRRVGKVSLRRGGVTPASIRRATAFAAQSMDQHLHHVALMRTAELVVRYEPGPVMPSDHLGYAGVFRCDEDLDQIFRRSEPPTHDDWEPRFLAKAERRLVNVALKRVRDIAEDFAAPPASRPAEASDLPIGEFSSQLAGLVPTLPGPGAAIPRQVAAATGNTTPHGGAGSAEVADQASDMSSAEGAGSRSRGNGADRRVNSSRPNLEIVEAASPAFVDDEAVIRLSFRVRPEGCGAVRVAAHPAVMTLDGGAVERDAPEAAQKPSVLRWISPEGRAYPSVTAITIPPQDDGVWTLLVTHLADAMVRVELDAEVQH